jgi:bifunctional non-homologous end joining protein LigD
MSATSETTRLRKILRAEDRVARAPTSGTSLDEYHRRRKFAETPEPAGRPQPRRTRRIFVVQKHDASRLHYDFRLAISGVLVSWAVPKGPSMNPSEKRLAVRTEDHPLAYAKFEGVIPAGQYGAGTVMVWDLGAYNPKNGLPPDEQLARGKIDIILQGKRLCGGFTLVRTGQRSGDRSQKERWLLIKHRDEYADPSWDVENPRLDSSVLTGRSMQEIQNGSRGKELGVSHARKRAASSPLPVGKR